MIETTVKKIEFTDIDPDNGSEYLYRVISTIDTLKKTEQCYIVRVHKSNPKWNHEVIQQMLSKEGVFLPSNMVNEPMIFECKQFYAYNQACQWIMKHENINYD
jgi:hypothetical protein